MNKFGIKAFIVPRSKFEKSLQWICDTRKEVELEEKQAQLKKEQKALLERIQKTEEEYVKTIQERAELEEMLGLSEMKEEEARKT